MRKYLLSLAAAGTALALASPATAQWYPRPAYGQNVVGRWQQEIRQLRFRMDQLRRQGRLTRPEAIDLNNDIRSTEAAIYHVGRRGVAPWEARQIDQRIRRVRQELRRYSDWDRRNYRDNRLRRY